MIWAGFRIYLGLSIAFAFAFPATVAAQRLVVSADHKSPEDFLSELSFQTGVNMIYSEEVIRKIPQVTMQMHGATLDEILKNLLTGSPVSYKIMDEQIVFFLAEPSPLRFSVSGVVTDSVSGEPLIYAYVYDAMSGVSAVTNNYGYYNLQVPAGMIQLMGGYLGYASKRLLLPVEKDQIIHLRLNPNSLLKPVIVNAGQQEKDKIIVPTADRITLSDLQSNIHLGGSSDLYRAMDFIPGVHTGTDGFGGIHVRGGANDQNLILMDGVPVYHPNHLLGVVSVFNYQVLQQASVYKANFPSRFSGRLSSVMDVRTREGNIHDWSVSGNIAASEIGLMTEGPIVKDKVGILLSGRFFLPGLFMRDLTGDYKKKNGVGGSADLDYFDFNGKINWVAGERDRLYFSVYQGFDKFSDQTITTNNTINEDSGVRVFSKEQFDKDLNWYNRTAVLRWNHIVNEQVFAHLTISRSVFEMQSVDKSDFEFKFPGSNLNPVTGFDIQEFKSGIEDVTARLELDIYPTTEHSFSGGLYGIKYNFKPKSITINEESKVGDFYLQDGLVDDIYFSSLEVEALEAGVYFEDKWEIDPKLKLTSGLHISGFFVQGVYYLDPQLRVSLDYMPANKLAFNVGYSRMAQYLHNLTSSSIGLPTDLWVPTTARVSPALSDQYSVSGIFKATEHLSIDLSAYLKDMRSLISYQEGASFLLREGLLPSSIVDAANWESKITEGNGDASGVELQFMYDNKTLQFKCNGTWSRAYRIFEDVNNGVAFPDRYDRRWSAGFSGQLHLGPKWSCGLNWLYGSGVAITLAESKYLNPGSFFPEVVINYSEKNGFRLPSYHRLDLSLNYLLSEKAHFNHSVTLNLYNVYNRVNPFYITLVQDPTSQQFEFKQFSLFGFFPSLSYRFTLQ